MKVIIGIDVGTSGVKVLAVDENCKVVSSNVTEYRFIRRTRVGRSKFRQIGGRRSAPD